MIRCFIGNMASGKSVMLAIYLEFAKNKYPDKKIVTNFYYKYSTHILTSEEIFEKAKNDKEFFRDTILAIDEIHYLVDARRASTLVNVSFTQFLTQLSKLKCSPFLYASQLYESHVDTRLRSFTDIMHLCERFVIDGNVIQLAVNEDRITKKQILIRNEMYVYTQGGKKHRKKVFYTIPTEDIFALFDTNQIFSVDRSKLT